MATTTTLTSAVAHRPDITEFRANDVIPEAIILSCTTVAGKVEGDAPSVRVPYVDDADADFIAEGNPIPESDPALAEVLVHTGKVAQLIRVSREQFLQRGTADLLSDSVRRAVTKRADRAFLAQVAPTAPALTPPAGLINIPGVIDGGAVEGDLDALVDMFATIETNGGTVSHLLLAPDAWASLRKLKTSTGATTSLLGAGTNDSARMLLDAPVIVTPAMPSGTGMAIDRTAIMSAIGEVQVAVSEHVYFTADSVGLRCTWRFGANLVRPDRAAKFTVAKPA